MTTHKADDVKAMARLDAVDVFKLAVDRSEKGLPQVAREMGWSDSHARRVFSTDRYFPSFEDLPRFCAVVGNTIIVQWLQVRAMTYGFQPQPQAVTCETLVQRIAELFSEMGDVGQKGADAIKDHILEPREIRSVIRELNDVVDKCMDLVADLRAMERTMTEGGRA
jgi:hypothetical protein